MELCPLLKNKKGDFTGILYLIVSIAAFAFFILVVSYIGTTISERMQEQISSDVEEVNDSFQSTKNVSENTLTAVWYVLFGGLLLGLLITAWYAPTHPILVPVFIILLVVGILVAVGLSNAYEKFYEVDQLQDAAETQGAVSYILLNLPYVALIVGLIGLIITFAKPKGGETPIA
ncbi:MAG: hypothetical protein ACOC5T_01745 [Elusimicrobiota bacterium]